MKLPKKVPIAPNGKGSALDPRTKLALALCVSVYVLGGAGGGIMVFLRPVLCAVPFALLAYTGRGRIALVCAAVYAVSFVARLLLPPDFDGVPGFLVLFLTDIFCRFLPSAVTWYYLISSTTVSEFTAAMHRMGVTDKIVIPLSVIFRFFPTVAEEARSINSAMRMRGIRLGGAKPGKLFEYRLVPLLASSVKIGDELSAAALVRGLGAPIKRTNICKIGFHAQDAIVLSVCAVVILGYTLNLAGVV